MLNVSFGSSVGKKFNEDGTFRPFPGNTIICLLDQMSEVFLRAKTLRNELASSTLSPCLAALPDESLHMTAIEGVCDQVRKQEYWTQKLFLDADLVSVDAFLVQQWKTLPPLGEVSMTFDHLRVDSGICIGLHPTSDEDEKRIRAWRDVVGDALGFRFPGHETYAFHISLAYGIHMPDVRQLEFLQAFKEHFDRTCKQTPFSFTVPEPSLTFFDDMSHFHTHLIPRSI